jgi:ribonuclease E
VPSGVEAVSEAAAMELPEPLEPRAFEAPSAPLQADVAPRTVEPAPAMPTSMAHVEPFELPTGDLQAVAEAAGLQWVNSDAEKIRAVQEAMANEPKPLHVPREPKPVVAVDEGPLVLVETRKDLTQFKLPFETSQGGSQPQA